MHTEKKTLINEAQVRINYCTLTALRKINGNLNLFWYLPWDSYAELKWKQCWTTITRHTLITRLSPAAGPHCRNTQASARPNIHLVQSRHISPLLYWSRITFLLQLEMPSAHEQREPEK